MIDEFIFSLNLIRTALSSASATNPVLSNICCYVAQDCTGLSSLSHLF